ncbi:MAG: HlyD family efflux transporter periplasmic adaptor subunit, partial [Candidatus Binatia bacterium]
LVVATVAATQLGGDSSAPQGPAAAPPPSMPPRITSLGRIEPKNGIYRIAGPSETSVVIATLRVDEGDRVEAGDVIAVLDTHRELEAEVQRLEVELAHAEREFRRYDGLWSEKIESATLRDEWWTKLSALKADLARARAALEKTTVRSPIRGQVIDVHAREGERVDLDGIVELAMTDEMLAVAEIYETDIGRVRIGQRATVSSPALAEPLGGKVERIGRKIGKLDVLDADPVAKTDARVVEVEIRLDDAERVAALTNLQVEVSIEP